MSEEEHRYDEEVDHHMIPTTAISAPLLLHHGHGHFTIPRKSKRSKSSLSSVTFAAPDGPNQHFSGFYQNNSAGDYPEYVSIIVGYAFGPKKMSTMGLIMAEASKMLEDEEEYDVQESFHSVRNSSCRNDGASHQDAKSLVSSGCASISLSGTLVPNFDHQTDHVVKSKPLIPLENDDPTLITCESSTDKKRVADKMHAFPSKEHFVRVSFVPLDLNFPLEEQHGGKFDVILHKLTEDILLSMSSDSGTCYSSICRKEATERLGRLEEYKKHRSSCCFVDPPESVRLVLSRSDIARTLSEHLNGVATISGVPVSTPRFHVVGQELGKPITFDFESLPFGFPIIAKPLTAAGTSESHKMMIVLNRNGLKKLSPRPTLLQEYANHDGILFKVYVLGEDVMVFQRSSLPNLPEGESNPGDVNLCTHLEFDSQKPYPGLSDFGVKNDEIDFTESCSDNKKSANFSHVVTSSEIRPVVEAVRKAFGLTLFGFDMLVTIRGGKMKLLVVDINYFPSYKEVSNFPFMLAQYLKNRAMASRMNVGII